MALNNRTIEKNLIYADENIEIELVSKEYTHTLEIKQSSSEKILQSFPLDPQDNTVVGCFDENIFQGNKKEEALAALSKNLKQYFGAKEIFVIPENETFPEYVVPQNHETGGRRLRHANRVELSNSTQKILDEYKELTTLLNDEYHFVSSIESLLEHKNPTRKYEEITRVLGETNFTREKMQEYKGKLQKNISRFENESVNPYFVLNKSDKVKGLIRVLPMGNKFSYLSDEVMIQDAELEKLLPLDKFKGETEAEKKQAREKFLLAYLINRMCKFQFSSSDHFIIIAADKREHIYDGIGFNKFEFGKKIPGWKVVMNFSAPQQKLQNIKAKIELLPLPQQPVNYKKFLPIAGIFLFGAAVVAPKLLQGASRIAENVIKPK